jgi:hypothetical protein
VFLSMVEPMARSACTNDTLKLLTIWYDVLSDAHKSREEGRPDSSSPIRLRRHVYSPTREGILDRFPLRDR